MNYLYDASEVNLYIANLGKYNEGEMVGGWISLPAEEETIEKFLREVVEIDEEYEEHFICDYESEFIKAEEYSSISKLNKKAEKISNLSEYEKNLMLAAIEHFGPDAIDFDIERFYLMENVYDYYDLGHYWATETGLLHGKTNPTLIRYFDFETFGKDLDMDTDGGFTRYGYIEYINS